MRSLRRQVVGVAALASFLLVAAATIVVHVVADRRLHDDFDDLVLAHLRGVAAAAEVEGGALHLRHRGSADLEVAVHAEDGRLLTGAADLLPPGVPGSLAAPRLADRDQRRVAWALVVPHNDDRQITAPVIVAVGLPRRLLDDELARLRLIAIVAGLGAFLLSAAALAWALDRSLRPVQHLAAAITRLDPLRRGGRLGQGDLPMELAPLAARVDELCDRLVAAHGLASSIRGAAAHELRTPLAGLRATIEVAQEVGGDPHAALATCHGIVLTMQARIDNLLMAARLDAGQLVPRREEVDAVALLDAAWAAQGVRVAERRLQEDVHQDGAGLAEADPEALRMVLANLVDNAVSHAPVGGTVRREVRDEGAFLLISIANRAPGLVPAMATDLFACGWRSRADDAPRHAGLGLAICRELVGMMHGTIGACVEDGWLRIDVRLPNASQEMQYW